MPARSLRLAVLLAAILGTLAAADLPAQTKSPGTGKPAAAPAPPPPVTSSAVYFRNKGSKADWRFFAYFSNEGEARKVFNHLAHSGWETELRISNTPIPKVRSTLTVKPTEVELISMQKCQEVFAWMARQKDIAYHFPVDGCYARAHLMVERMQKNGFKPRKVWSVANGEALFAKTKNHPRGYVTWGYHVAPILGVRDGKEQRWYAIDPSLFDRPVILAEWMKAQMRTSNSSKPFVTITKIGEAPLWVDHKKKPGTGYWPTSDPKDGAHNHAVATMRKYKPWEGKQPPRGTALLAPGPRPAWEYRLPPRAVAWLGRREVMYH
jgi:hypothetical protein